MVVSAGTARTCAKSTARMEIATRSADRVRTCALPFIWVEAVALSLVLVEFAT